MAALTQLLELFFGRILRSQMKAYCMKKNNRTGQSLNCPHHLFSASLPTVVIVGFLLPPAKYEAAGIRDSTIWNSGPPQRLKCAAKSDASVIRWFHNAESGPVLRFPRLERSRARNNKYGCFRDEVFWVVPQHVPSARARRVPRIAANFWNLPIRR